VSLTNSKAAYTDCYRLFELAVATPGGIRTPFATREAASYYQMRMNQARVLLRAQSKRVYSPDHPAYDRSEYDPYKVQVLESEDGEWWVYVKPHGDWAAIANAEPIPADETGILPPNPHHAQLTHNPESTNVPEPNDLD
jgi:hypothetical protein